MPERDLHFPPVRRTVRAKYRFSDLYQEGLLDGEVFRFADGRRQDSEVALRWVERCKAEREERQKNKDFWDLVSRAPVWQPEPPPKPEPPPPPKPRSLVLLPCDATLDYVSAYRMFLARAGDAGGQGSDFLAQTFDAQWKKFRAGK